MDQSIHTQINNLSREEIVKILEDYGFACYDSDVTDELRDALKANIEDGTIEPSIFDDPPVPGRGSPG